MKSMRKLHCRDGVKKKALLGLRPKQAFGASNRRSHAHARQSRAKNCIASASKTAYAYLFGHYFLFLGYGAVSSVKPTR
jgi:hypothetical protein